MTRHGCDILNLEWASRGRDIDIVEPVLSYLELEYGLRIARDSIFNAGWKLLKYRPRLFLIADQGGATINFQAVRLATRMGIPVVTLRSEGMFPDDPDAVRQVFWGWNADHRLYETLHLEWSERNIRLSHLYAPESCDYDMRVSGATGFDRYRLFSMESRQQFLERHSLDAYEHLVGLAGWAFSHVAGEYYGRHMVAVETELGGPEAVELHRRALLRLRTEYRQLVQAHPETLFVARFHPGEVEEDSSEFTLLAGLPNVVFSRRSDDNIADIISACDLWLAYESTTTLEAWLLDKPTMLLNPLGGDFRRAAISAGSPVVRSAEEVAAALTELRATGAIGAFDALRADRESLIDSTIGYSDGRNHVRAAQHVADVMSRPAPKPKWSADVIRQLFAALKVQTLLRLGVGNRSSVLRATQKLREMFDPAQREEAHRRYRSAVEEFHA